MLNVCTNLEFKLIKEIGLEGRNSKVFLAIDPQLNAELIVKQIQKSSFGNQSEYFSEAQKLYCTKHPNIMEIQCASQDDDYVYFSMPFCKRGSLNSLMDRKFLTVREIVKYSLDFLSGLHFMHTKGLTHFDIKPTNLLISDTGKLLITDFGLSKYVNDSGFATQDTFYCIHKPPEAFIYSNLTNSADIYQAGLTMYRMCNGNEFFKNQLQYMGITSFSDLEKAILDGKFPNRKAYLPHIPLKLQKLINSAISVDTKDRFETVLDMMNKICTIEENMDWVYNEDKNICSQTWSLENDTHIKVIELFKNKNLWDISGKKIRKSDNTQTKISKLCSTGHKKHDDASKLVVQMLKNA